MKPRFRPWQLALGLAVVCVGGVAFLIWHREAAAISPAEMATYLPRRESIMFYIDLHAIRDAGLLDKFSGAAVNEEDDYRKFVAESGFDYKTDLDAVLGSSFENTTLFLLRGRFDWKALMDYANRHGGSCHNGFCKLPTSKIGRFVSFYAPASQLLAFAVSNQEDEVSEIKHSKGPLVLSSIPQAPIWLSMRPNELAKMGSLPPGTKQFINTLKAAEWVTLSLGPDQQRFALALDASCKTQEDAAGLRASLEDLTSLLKRLIAREKQTPNPKDLSGVLTAGNFQRVDRHVIGKWPLEKVFFESLTD